MTEGNKLVYMVEILLSDVEKMTENSKEKWGQVSLDTFEHLKGVLQSLEDSHAVKSFEQMLLKTLKQVRDNLKSLEFNHWDKLLMEELKKNLESFEKIVNLEGVKNKEKQERDQDDGQVRRMSEDWLRIENRIHDSPIMSSLRLSINNLPSNLRLCLLYFAPFPERAIINRRLMTYWWSGEGFISYKAGDKITPEEVGEKILTDLAENNLAQPYKEPSKLPIVRSYTIHPFISRLLQDIAKSADFIEMDRKEMQGNALIKNGWRRVCLHKDDPSSADFLTGDLVTIFNGNQSYLNFTREAFERLEKLRVLHLGNWRSSPNHHHIEAENTKFLDGLKAMKYLKYLSLRGISRITTIPNSVLECSNLEILDLKACHNLESLPSRIGFLRKLIHLDVSECFFLENMPRDITKLRLLQVLKGFVVGPKSRTSSNYCQLNDLSELKRLRKLKIYMRRAELEHEDSLLDKFQNLRILTIIWRLGSNKEFTGNQMDWLKVPEKLEKLDLRCYPRTHLPNLPNPSAKEPLQGLTRLYIRGGFLQHLSLERESKEEDGKFSNVKILQLKYVKDLQLEAGAMRKLFPNLTYFNFLFLTSDLKQEIMWEESEGFEKLETSLRNVWSEEKVSKQIVTIPTSVRDRALP